MAEPEKSIEEWVRNRAYILWERAGRPEGRDEEFWHQAWADWEAEFLRGRTAPSSQDRMPLHIHGRFPRSSRRATWRAHHARD